MPDEFAPAYWIEQHDGVAIPLCGSCSIGRTPENSLVVDDHLTSRRHAVILAREDGQYWLVDFSLNGTFINGRRMLHAQRLRNGDEIRVAKVAYVFRTEFATGGDTTRWKEFTPTRPAAPSTEPAWILVGDLEKFTILCQRLPLEEVATVIGNWLKTCTEIVEQNGGAIHDYLGDGFLACWRRPEENAGQVVEAIRQLRTERARSPAPFRVILNYGEVAFGATPSLGEGVLGSAVNLVFRLEKVAAALNLSFSFTESAYGRLAGHFPLVAVPGEFEVKSYSPKFRLYTFAEELAGQDQESVPG